MLMSIYSQKKARIERTPAWIWSGHKVTYQLYFPEISELGAISWIGRITQFRNTMFYPILVKQLIFLYNSRLVTLNHGSLVPTPCMEHSACMHTAKVVVVVGAGGEDDVHYGTLAPCGRTFVKK